MAQLFANNAAGALAGAITAANTALTLQTGQGAAFPAPAAGLDFFLATLFTLTNGVETAREIVKVTARAGDALTIARGQEGSVAQAWPAGSRIELRATAETLDRLKAGGHRNRVINGAMRVDQRNAGIAQAFTAGAELAYGADRYYVFCSGDSINGRQIALANGQSRYRLYATGPSVTGVGLGQRIEAKNSLDLAGRTVTLQAKLYSTSLTSVGWAIYYASTTDSFGTLAAPTRTLIAAGNFTITTTEAIYTAQANVPAAAVTGLEIVFTGGALPNTEYLVIGDVQLEEGAVATPFERRPVGLELALCQRYFTHLGKSAAGVIGQWGYVGAGGLLGGTLALPVEMRATPTVTRVGTLLVSNVGQPAVTAAGTKSVSITATGVAAGDAYWKSNAASGYFTASAEL